MISTTVQNAINEQIKHEFFSSYLYLSMSAYFETLSLPGFASWMRVQSQEEHERKVTALIHRLYELALKESDYATQTLLQWFITEQVEEEKNAGQIVEQLKMTGGEPSALLLLDRDLAGRGAAA